MGPNYSGCLMIFRDKNPTKIGWCLPVKDGAGVVTLLACHGSTHQGAKGQGQITQEWAKTKSATTHQYLVSDYINMMHYM